MTGVIFIAEFSVLAYQRWGSKAIDAATFKKRVLSSFMSNAAGVVGGSLGAAIGCFIGNLITPGIGGYVGSLIGGLMAGVGAQMGTDYLLDGSSYTLEKYE